MNFWFPQQIIRLNYVRRDATIRMKNPEKWRSYSQIGTWQSIIKRNKNSPLLFSNIHSKHCILFKYENVFYIKFLIKVCYYVQMKSSLHTVTITSKKKDRKKELVALKCAYLQNDTIISLYLSTYIIFKVATRWGGIWRD